MREIAVRSEAEEVTAYNALEAAGKSEDGKHLRDKHQKFEEDLWTLENKNVRSPFPLVCSH